MEVLACSAAASSSDDQTDDLRSAASTPVSQEMPAAPLTFLGGEASILAEHQTTGCFEAPIRSSVDAPVNKSGMFSKEGGVVKSWRSRFFLLDGMSLRYYRPSIFCWRGDPVAAVLVARGIQTQGQIPLRSISAVKRSRDENDRPEIHVATVSGRTYKLRPELTAGAGIHPENVVSAWLEALQHNIRIAHKHHVNTF
jgi:hypothetical protein